jgi:transcriptional regulator with XRE-family HTH domain
MGISSTKRHDGGMMDGNLPKIDLIGVGARLDAVRAATGLDKGVFADTVDIDASSYSKIIKGEKPLKIDMGFRVAERWNVSLDFLYRGSLDGLPSSLSAKVIETLTKR